MIELTLKQSSVLLSMFAHTNYGALAAGTLEGSHPGRVFADNLTHPTIALVCTKVGYYFLAGSPNGGEYLPSIRELFQQELAPKQYKKSEDPQILLFYDPSEWKEPLFQTFQGLNPRLIHKNRMILPPNTENRFPQAWQSQIPQGMRMAPISLELLEQHHEEASALKQFWGSPSRFVEKSLGFWLMEGDSITCSCEAVFIGKGEAEISIATPLGYRRRGLARLTASAFIEACLNRGLKPIWGCWPDNLPSVALAHSLGFEVDIVQDICFFEYHPHGV